MSITRPSQTLLEAVLAIGVILTATLGSSTLIISTITAGRASQDRIEAANLAREGIEAVRMTRDSNWLKRDQNVRDCSPPASCTAVTEWDDNGPTSPNAYTPLGTTSGKCWQLLFDSGLGQWQLYDAGAPSGSPPQCPATVINEVTDSSTGAIYLTEVYAPLGSTPTKYKRRLMVIKQTDTTAVGSVDYLDVVSTVTWASRIGNRSYTAEERLYNWK